MLTKFQRTFPLYNLQKIFVSISLTTDIGQNCRTFSASTKLSTSKLKSPVSSWNEWDPLEEVIVGVPDLGVVPYPYPETTACFGARLADNFMKKNGGKYWSEVMPKEVYQNVLKEHKEFVNILKGEGVKVVHPIPMDMKKEYTTPFFKSCGLDLAFPRDIILVIGDEIMETTMTWRSRFFEYLGYRPLLIDYWKRGANFQSAPKPMCSDESFKKNFDISGDKFEELGYVTTEFEPMFDAADFMRAGRDVFAQQSHVTNATGIEWMRRHLAEKGIRLHLLDFKDPYAMHIDATFFTVKPGYLIENPEVINPYADFITKAGWKIVKGPKPADRSDMYEGMSYKWLSMNVLVLDEKRVLVEKREVGMHKMFESIGMQSIKVDFGHCFAVGGGLHCWTSDVRRKGTLENYFNWPQEVLDKVSVQK